MIKVILPNARWLMGTVKYKGLGYAVIVLRRETLKSLPTTGTENTAPRAHSFRAAVEFTACWNKRVPKRTLVHSQTRSEEISNLPLRPIFLTYKMVL